MSNLPNQSVAFLGLGSNLGDRRRNLLRAVSRLDRHALIHIEMKGGIAALYETSPVGGASGQPPHLNSVLRVRTSLSPWELLAEVLDIEDSLGRVRNDRWGPRVIDIDLLLFDDRVIDDGVLVLPHPRLDERRFVLEPLCDIASEVIHPVCGRTFGLLAKHARKRYAEQAVERVGDAHWAESAANHFGCPREPAVNSQ